MFLKISFVKGGENPMYAALSSITLEKTKYKHQVQALVFKS